MSNDQTPASLPTDPTDAVNSTDPVDPTAPAETGSTMDLPFVEELPPVAAETASLPVDPAYAAYGDPVPPPAQPPVADPVETPAYAKAPILRGPSPWTVVYGLIALAVAVLVFVTNATSARIDWGTAGPATVVGLGIVLVLLGLLGMRGRRRLDA
jgi:hypothetical protein